MGIRWIQKHLRFFARTDENRCGCVGHEYLTVLAHEQILTELANCCSDTRRRRTAAVKDFRGHSVECACARPNADAPRERNLLSPSLADARA